ncbi:RNA ligase family protein [Pseudomonas sp. BIGb0427]|uniref:RNA ligase family protein n=1 Tax=unclassified Pseudomonas TaxID=196821 RepID=UPI0018A7ACED|nr:MULTISPECIES: RNA ligase family protein [unclassified Pseudomonas]QPG61434.1 RNA ligase family protein [Pseudomonas sp. BIGb0427]UVM68950.1 RNA ligase family protein [Pseudomonas sp. B21-009]
MTLDIRELAQLDLFKYPRTPHLQSSRLQSGDSDHDQLPYSELKGQYLVVEEKLDGANAAISFSAAGELLLQSRGHYLAGGSRERQFNQFKQWAACHEHWLLEHLEDRYVLFGEVMSKRHSVFYDQLPHLFFEFDIWDRKAQVFLSTARRQQLLAGGPVLSVPVLFEGIAPPRLKDLLALVGHSQAKSKRWKDAFAEVIARQQLDFAKAWNQGDRSDLMEGLYLKIETAEHTTGRIKWVRHDFVQAILEADEHHLRQPYIPNLLAAGVDLYAPEPQVTWASLQAAEQGVE